MGNAEDRFHEFVYFFQDEIVLGSHVMSLRRELRPLTSQANKSHAGTFRDDGVWVPKSFKWLEPFYRIIKRRQPWLSENILCAAPNAP